MSCLFLLFKQMDFFTVMLRSWYIRVCPLALIRLQPASSCSAVFEDSIILSSAGFGHCSLHRVIDVRANTRAQVSHPTLPAFKITYCLHIFVTYQHSLNGHWRSLFAWFVFVLYPRIFSPSGLASLAGSKVNSTKARVANSRYLYI